MIVKDNIIIVRYGEISLKSNYVRRKFENILIKNIRNALEKNEISCEITKERGRIYISTDKINDSLLILKRIFGIVSFSKCIKTKSKVENISEKAIVYAENKLKKNMSFAVRSNRAGNHDFTSQDVSVKVGSEIVKNYESKVDLTNPDYELFIDIREEYTYIFDKKIKGPGGMPVGSQDKIITLIDTDFSLLSSWYLLRRGCENIFYVSKNFNLDKLENFCKNWFISKNFLFFDEKDNFFQDINKASKDNKCKAVVSGIYDVKKNIEKIKIFQENINIPILYPLIAMDKEDINKEIEEKGINV